MPKKPCKPGKTPTRKNGRCVKSKTCKNGKTPTGKNGRCVFPKGHVRTKRVKSLTMSKISSLTNMTNRSSSPVEQTIDLKLIIYKNGEKITDINDYFGRDEVEEIMEMIQQMLDVKESAIDDGDSYIINNVNYNKTTGKIGNRRQYYKLNEKHDENLDDDKVQFQFVKI